MIGPETLRTLIIILRTKNPGMRFQLRTYGNINGDSRPRILVGTKYSDMLTASVKLQTHIPARKS